MKPQTNHQTGAKRVQQTRHVQTDTDSQDDMLNEHEPLFNILEQNTPPPPLVTVELNGAKAKIEEVDAGASASIISEETYKTLWPEEPRPKLETSERKLRTYTGEKIMVKGQLTVDVGYREQAKKLPLLGKGPSLLARDWLLEIRLDWQELRLHTLQTAPPTNLKRILNNHSPVFTKELERLKGVQAKIHIEPDATPIFKGPRSIPFALRPKVHAELERLVKAGVIEPVQFSDWAAQIVPVMKPDGSVRICGDYKVTVNQVAEPDSYPIPWIDYLFASLAGGQTFSKLDLAHAYQQVELEENSKKLTVINTPKGLFQYNRLPFGVSAAPAIFQRTIEGVLQGIPNVCVYLDDILITGKTETEDLRNLDAVLTRLEEADDLS